MKKYSNKTITQLFLCACLLIVLSCNNKEEAIVFKSNFEGIGTRTFIGPEYWSNRMQDWQVSNGLIECLVSNKNRSIHLLTHQLGTEKENLEMKVRIGFYNQSISSKNKNWAGFSIGGSKGEFLDYRDNAIFGKGINIGVCTNGGLFIGEPSIKNHKNDNIINSLVKGIDLKVKIIPLNENYTINFSAYDVDSGKLFASISKSNISANLLTGNLGLVSNFKNLNPNCINHTKSVWFKSWEIKGNKIKLSN